MKDYNSAYDCIVKTFNVEGVRGFYKGGVLNYFRGIGATMCLVMFDKLKEISTNRQKGY